MAVGKGRQTRGKVLLKCLILCPLLGITSSAQEPNFHDAPASAKTEKNPYQGQQTAAGQSAFQQRCAACHGPNGEGTGNVPALASERRKGPATANSSGTSPRAISTTGMPAWQIFARRTTVENYQLNIRALGASKPGSPRVKLSADEAVAVGTERASTKGSVYRLPLREAWHDSQDNP